MRKLAMPTRIALVALAALLALPLAPTASPVAAKQRPRTITRTFRNTAPVSVDGGINFPSPVSATLYPSTIAVGGLKGKVRDVNVRLDNLTHTLPGDVQVLLVGPRGQTAIVMADVGGIDDVVDVTLRLDDEAAEPLPDGGFTTLQSGTFRPKNAGGQAIAFNAPAPSASANAALSIFDGSDPNGTWRLFVQDAYGPTDSGIVEGWELEIKTRVKAKRKR